MGAFWDGFEKRAGLLSGVQSVGRAIGNVTGARHLATGLKQTKRLVGGAGGLKNLGSGQFAINPAYQKSLASAGQNLATGVKRMGGTALATGGTMYAGSKLLGSNQQQPQGQW